MSNSHKDPVCGMTVLPERGLRASYRDRTVYFCSEYCRDKFLERPESYFAELIVSGYDKAKEHRRIAYFSMEVAVASSIPTYAGGLGVLAGDTLKSCADLRVPVVGVTLLYRKGYFTQKFDEAGAQQEWPVRWNPEHFMEPLPETVDVEIERRVVRVRAWQYTLMGSSGYSVPLVFLDTAVEGNADGDRALTDCLYGGDQRYRLAQEVLLGIGGMRMLDALGYRALDRFHMNEGHASLLVLELLAKQSVSHGREWDFEGVKNRCVFTTHTSVPAGHDQFEYELVERVLPRIVPFEVTRMLGGRDRLNMTLLGFNLSRYVNGVAKRHEQVSREMFPGYDIHHVTNGVHSSTWTCDSFRALYERHLPGWDNDPAMLRQAIAIPRDEIWAAHTEAKARLLALIAERTGRALIADALTIGFARRTTPYKRADLIFSDVGRLLAIARHSGPLQFVFAGKAHPNDYGGKALMRRIAAVAREIGGEVPVVYLENYELELARLVVSGTDLWLNTPQRPLEASGTSGMKAAHNGVPSFSTLDGWWVEGHLEGLTGWSIGQREAEAPTSDSVNRQDAEDLYEKLGGEIVPMFYRHRERWIDIMRQSIALNASYFNTHRMVQQYVTNAYLP
jgi:starch phosphorylase